MSVLALTGAAVAGGAVGWWVARRNRVQALAAGAGAHLLPDPALEWLRRSHNALGVWIAEISGRDDGPTAERIVDDRLSATEIIAVDRRLERARDQEQSGVERMASGTLVFHGEGGAAVALLLPDGASAEHLALARDDTRRLLDGVHRRPQIVAMAQATTQEASLESAGSVGLRLAYQLERMLGAQVVVVANDAADPAPRPDDGDAPAVRVVGVSGRADRRILGTVLPVNSPLAGVALGSAEPGSVQTDPLGGAVTDRRQHARAVLLLPIVVGREPVGAVAIWVTGSGEPSGSALAELMETLVNAGPRLRRAVLADQRQSRSLLDPLTSLANRRGFDEILGRVGAEEGALIYADLDRFKSLNDTLGHPAGDAALVHFSQIIRSQIRGDDTGARIGGEEFAVWLPRTGMEAAALIAERIRLRFDTIPWEWQRQPWPLSASFGVAACPETSRSPANLPAQADAALYAAKRGGRNRVERAVVA